MSPILLAIIIVAVIGLVLGLVLAIASIVMAVPVDEKAEAIQGVLAGANCGACGYSGCAGYAAALSKGECTPEAGMLFSDVISGLERVSDHATNIAFAIIEQEKEAS